MNKSIYELIAERRSTREYTTSVEFDHSAVGSALELATLAPNSSNMQLWEFHRVKGEKLLELIPACLGQISAATANELVVFTTVPHKWKSRVQEHLDRLNAIRMLHDNESINRVYEYYLNVVKKNYSNDPLAIKGILRRINSSVSGLSLPSCREVRKRDVRTTLHKNTSMAAMIFMLVMKEKGFDTCAMEGIDSKMIKKILGLDSRCEITMVVSCGTRARYGIYGEQIRTDSSEVIFSHG